MVCKHMRNGISFETLKNKNQNIIIIINNTAKELVRSMRSLVEAGEGR